MKESEKSRYYEHATRAVPYDRRATRYEGYFGREPAEPKATGEGATGAPSERRDDEKGDGR